MPLLFSNPRRTPPRRPQTASRPRPALAALPLLLFACVSLAPRPARAQSRPQPPPIEREIKGGELHTFRLLLTAGQFVRAVFDQRGADIVLTLVGPDGEELARVDSPVGESRPEPLFFEVGRGGYYTYQVRTRREWAPPGRYEFTMTARGATPQDLRSFPAERAFAEGTRALSDGGPEALERGVEKYEQALVLFRSLGDYRGEITTLLTIAAVVRALGGGEQALRYYEEALALLRTTTDTADEARAESN